MFVGDKRYHQDPRFVSYCLKLVGTAAVFWELVIHAAVLGLQRALGGARGSEKNKNIFLKLYSLERFALTSLILRKWHFPMMITKKF